MGYPETPGLAAGLLRCPGSPRHRAPAAQTKGPELAARDPSFSFLSGGRGLRPSLTCAASALGGLVFLPDLEHVIVVHAQLPADLGVRLPLVDQGDDALLHLAVLLRHPDLRAGLAALVAHYVVHEVVAHAHQLGDLTDLDTLIVQLHHLAALAALCVQDLVHCFFCHCLVPTFLI